MKERKQQLQRPGAPLGNQNARKHGFYSTRLTRQERRAYNEASREFDLEDEIALLRAKLNSILKVAPENYGVLLRALSALTRAVSVSRLPVKKFGDSPEELKQILIDVVNDVGLLETNGSAAGESEKPSAPPRSDYQGFSEFEARR